MLSTRCTAVPLTGEQTVLRWPRNDVISWQTWAVPSCL